jgi:hypothetical protein
MELPTQINYRKKILLGLTFFLALFHSIFIFGIRGADCPSNWLTLTEPCTWSPLYACELYLWIIALLLLFFELKWDHDFRKFLHTLLSNWPVLVFIFFAVLSIAWSVLPKITLFRVFVFFSSTVLAMYIGYKFTLEQIIKILCWLFGFVNAFCILIVLTLPELGIMQDSFYKGAWNGIFWHRNYLGCFMSLGMLIYFYNLTLSKTKKIFPMIVNLCMFLVSFFLLIKSKSVTGLLSALVIVGFVLLFWVWKKLHQKLKVWHYLSFSGIVLIVSLFVLKEVAWIFKLFGRSSTMTGRIPMWSYLFDHLIIQKSILGYGYGALWHLSGIREGISEAVNWKYPVFIGDNGYLDIQLHLGVIGILLLVGLLVLGIRLAAQYLRHNNSNLFSFPIVFLIFFLFANISLSLILESEVFMWLIGLAISVSINRNLSTQQVL